MRRTTLATFLLTAALTLTAQTPPKPQATQAPGAAPNKVWVNTPTKVYHCPGARYYGRSKTGQYMTEPDAKKAGNKPAHGEACFK